MAFESLSDKLTEAFKRLRGKGRLTEADVKEAMREVKLALLEADVNFKVVKDFVKRVTARATGADVLESLSPAQMVIKIVNEELCALMGSSPPGPAVPGILQARILEWVAISFSKKASILRHSAFFIVQLAHPYMTTGKTIALTRRTFVGKVMSLLFNMLSRLVITFLPRSKRLLISSLQSPSAVIFEPRKIKSATVSTVSPSISHELMGPDAMIFVF